MNHETVPFATAERVLPSGWCPDDDTRHNVIARRNVLAAFWAGSVMGLKGDALSDYAVEVHSADHTVPGDADIVAKLRADLLVNGHGISEAELRARLRQFHRQALVQLLATD